MRQQYKYSALFLPILCRLMYLFYFLFAGVKCYALLCGRHLNFNIMKTIKQLEQELKDLQQALKDKTISVNEYSSFYYNVSQQIKKLS